MIDPPEPGWWWRWFARIALVAAVLGALALARRRPDYKPAASFLIAMGAANILRPLLIGYVIAPARLAGRVPHTGLERVAFHVDQAVFLLWPAGLAALAVWTFWRSRRAKGAVALAYAALVAVLVLGYPTIRRELLASVYLGVELTALLVSIGAVASWWWRRTPTTIAESIALLLVIFDVVLIAGPYAAGSIFTTWPIAFGMYGVLYTAITVMEVVWFRRK